MLLAILFSAVISVPATQAEAVHPEMACKAVYRTLDDKNETVERSKELPSQVYGRIVRHEARLEGKLFTLTEDNGSFFAQIITSQEPAKGTVVRGAPDKDGQFTATEVAGVTVYRLECGRKR